MSCYECGPTNLTGFIKRKIPQIDENTYVQEEQVKEEDFQQYLNLG